MYKIVTFTPWIKCELWVSMSGLKKPKINKPNLVLLGSHHLEKSNFLTVNFISFFDSCLDKCFSIIDENSSLISDFLWVMVSCIYACIHTVLVLAFSSVYSIF